MVELVIVILIIAVLAVAVFVGGGAAIEKSRDKRVTSDFKNFEVGIEECLYSNQQFQNGATLTTLAAQQDAVLELNPFLSANYAFDVNALAPTTGDIRNSDTSLYAFQSKKLDPWGNPYYFVADSQPRNENMTETYITVFSAGANGKADIGGTVDGDDQFLLVQFVNGEVLSKTYKIKEAPKDAAGKVLSAGVTKLSSTSGVAPVNRAAVTLSADTGTSSGSGSSSGGSHGGGTTPSRPSEGGSSSGGSGSGSGSSSSGDQTACQHEYSSKITKAATCSAAGVKTYTCSKCGNSYTEAIEKVSHKYGESHRCTMCGEKDPSYKPEVPTLAKRNTWYKSSVSKKNITKITFVDEYLQGESADEVWNADVNNNGDIKCYRKGKEVVIAGNGSGKIKANPDSSSMFKSIGSSNDPMALRTIENLTLLDTSEVTNMGWMFAGCEKLINLDLSEMDTSNVKTMQYMFLYCYNLKSLDLSNFNTSNVANMYGMFFGCSTLVSLNISSFNTEEVADMSWMFSDCESLVNLDLSSFNTNNVTDMSYMFKACRKLAKLDLSSFNTSKVTDMSMMFSSCESLTDLNIQSFDTGNVGDMSSMFDNCLKLETIDLSSFTMDAVYLAHSMFAESVSLKTILVSWNWELDSDVISTAMFDGCTSLSGAISYNPEFTDGTYATVRSGYLTLKA